MVGDLTDCEADAGSAAGVAMGFVLNSAMR